MAKSNFITQILKWLGFDEDNVVGQIGNHFQSWLNSQTGAGLTGAEQEANAFTAEQAALSRQWQENMRATNYQTQVQDMKQAGLNPALMYASGGSSSTPSGASATSVAPNSPTSLQEILGLAKLKKELKLLDSQSRNVDSQTDLNKATQGKTEVDTQLQSLVAEYYPKLTDAQISEISASATEKIAAAGAHEASASLSYAKAAEANASADFIKAQKIIKEKEAQWYDRLKQAELDLKGAETDKAKQEAILNECRALVEEFRNGYMRTYNTEVPNGALVSLVSCLTNVLTQLGGSYFLSREAWQEFCNALYHSGNTRIDVNNNSTTPINMSPGTSGR